MFEKYYEFPKLPEKMGGGGDSFNLEKFLKENNIDRKNPKITEKIAKFEKSVQNRRNLTKEQLLDLLAYHEISGIYINIKREIKMHSHSENNNNNTNIQDAATISTETASMNNLNKESDINIQNNITSKIVQKSETEKSETKNPKIKTEKSEIKTEKLETENPEIKTEKLETENSFQKPKIKEETQNPTIQKQKIDTITTNEIPNKTGNNVNISPRITTRENNESDKNLAKAREIEKQLKKLFKENMSQQEIENFLKSKNIEIKQHNAMTPRENLTTNSIGISGNKKEKGAKYAFIDNREFELSDIRSIAEINGRIFISGYGVKHYLPGMESYEHFRKSIPEKTNTKKGVSGKKYPIDAIEIYDLETNTKSIDKGLAIDYLKADGIIKPIDDRTGSYVEILDIGGEKFGYNYDGELVEKYRILKGQGPTSKEIKADYAKYREAIKRNNQDKMPEQEPRGMQDGMIYAEIPNSNSYDSHIKQKTDNKVNHNPNDYMQDGYRIQKNGNSTHITKAGTNIRINNHGTNSASGNARAGNVCINGKCF